MSQEQLQIFDTVNIVQKLIKIVEAFDDSKELQIAFLGYTDLMLPNNEWANVFEGKPERVAKLVNRQNAENLKRIHGRPDVSICTTLGSTVKALFDERVKEPSEKRNDLG